MGDPSLEQADNKRPKLVNTPFIGSP